MTPFLKNTLLTPFKTLMGRGKQAIFLFSQFNFPVMNYLFKPSLWVVVLMMSLYGVSCQKETDNPVHTVSGKVLEYGTKKPVPDAAIYILKHYGTLLGPEGFTFLDSTKTDANGKYTFKTTEGDYMKVVKQGYFKMYSTDYAHIPINILSKRPTSVTQDIVIDPIGWLKIHVKNVKPVADNDNIGFSNYSCAPNEMYGKSVDAITVCPQRGNRKNNIIYFVNRHSVSVFHQDSIYIKGLDTTYYSINY
jgi:hypothetical protein